MTIDTLFFDVGGVLLSNGWDGAGRRHVADEMGIDFEEFAGRHELVADAFETGEIDLSTYLDRTVFHKPRPFDEAEFVEHMLALSRADDASLDLASRLKRTGRYLMAILNNESKALNQHRIDAFGLRERFHLFLSSSIVGVKKPDERIYRLALEITQRDPSQCLFVDDRPVNLESAADLGMEVVEFTDAASFERDLARLGVSP